MLPTQWTLVIREGVTTNLLNRKKVILTQPVPTSFLPPILRRSGTLLREAIGFVAASTSTPPSVAIGKQNTKSLFDPLARAVPAHLFIGPLACMAFPIGQEESSTKPVVKVTESEEKLHQKISARGFKRESLLHHSKEPVNSS